MIGLGVGIAIAGAYRPPGHGSRGRPDSDGSIFFNENGKESGGKNQAEENQTGGANSTSPQTPSPGDDNDKTSRDKKIRSHEKALEEHKQKLTEYKENPDKFDNKGFLKNAPSQEVRDSIIQGRIRTLENTISNIERQIDSLKGMP